MTIYKHPWTYRTIIQVGGCRYVGFDVNTNLLLICSTAGRGVVDCASGIVIARERSEYEPERQEIANGIGPLSQSIVNVMNVNYQKSGVSNPIVPKNCNKWTIVSDSRYSIFLVPPYSHSCDDYVCIWDERKDAASPLSSFAISHSEKYIAIASSSEVFIYANEDSIQDLSSYSRHVNYHPFKRFVK